MNIISWNVRGLGGPTKNHLVRDFLAQYKPNIICIQESKLEVIVRPTWRAIVGSSLNCFSAAAATGSSGGMIIGRNGSLFHGNLFHSGPYCLTVEFVSVHDQIKWHCTTVYGPNARNLKLDFWAEIRSCKPPSGIPWIIYGDFNTIFSSMDKNSGNICWDDIYNGQALLRDLDLVDLRLHGRL
ncbi:RNA-directed DNA polymerase protein [Dioscorea alata]|uniref:RNA-directed DNA polymerase protein n=1 Tax=Dioscorea alata TaxID=55571 RepID=A0ACB7V0X8_DIOAL|nr:RNA-directed DNA polymerase protein [Dioscorea alata]